MSDFIGTWIFCTVIWAFFCIVLFIIMYNTMHNDRATDLDKQEAKTYARRAGYGVIFCWAWPVLVLIYMLWCAHFLIKPAWRGINKLPSIIREVYKS